MGTLLCAWVLASIGSGAGDGAASPIRIMPVGDSITVGFTDNRDGWKVPFGFGYRSGLYTRLVNAGHAVQYVGQSGEPWTYPHSAPPGTVVEPDLRALGQDQHRGYGGKGINYIAANIPDWLKADDPDVVLLMIGINDIPQGSPRLPDSVKTRFSALVKTIVTEKPDAYLIIAQITPYAKHTEAIAQYNDFIRNTVVPHYAALGKHVATVDQYSNFLTQTGAVDGALYSNGINHPNQAGYDRMAQTWFEGIQKVFASQPGFSHQRGAWLSLEHEPVPPAGSPTRSGSPKGSN